MAISYFISYSHHDQSLMEPVVQLVKLNKTYVFFDKASIEPGTIWEDEIYKGILKSDKMLVFWCHHSMTSAEITKEYDTAIKLGKAIVPVLLDSSELPESLRQYQWIDFRKVVGEHNGIVYDEVSSKIKPYIPPQEDQAKSLLDKLKYIFRVRWLKKDDIKYASPPKKPHTDRPSKSSGEVSWQEEQSSVSISKVMAEVLVLALKKFDNIT